MAYEVVYEASFGRDLLGTVDYLAKDLASPQAAKKLVDAIDRAVSTLAATPHAHAISLKPIMQAHELRECLVRNYTIVYRVDDDSRIVRLHRLFHQTQQYDDSWYWKEEV